MAAEYPTRPSQTIFRKKKRHGWTTLDNNLLDDERLSFKAVGLLCFLLSKPDHWRFNYRHITTTHSDGESAVRSGMSELEKFGYLTRERQRQGDGTLAWIITVHEEPVTPGASPCGGFPRMDNPGVEDRHLVITDGGSTEEVTLLPLLSEERAPSKREAGKKELEAEFSEWWDGVWRKERKQGAMKHYLRIRSKGLATREQMFLQRDAYAKLMVARGREQEHMRMPANWLADGEWDEEIPVEKVPDPFSGPEMRFG